MAQPKKVDWRVILIGGSSGTGKTIVAQKLAQHFGTSVLQVDDIRLALQQVTSPEQHPELHFFVTRPAIWQLSPEDLCEGLIQVGRAIMPALEIVIAHHLAVDESGPIILEGDGILPWIATRSRFDELGNFYRETVSTHLKAFFLYEPDQSVILQNMLKRKRGIEHNSPQEQQNQAEASLLYGRWLRQEAINYNLPVLEVQPWNTLVNRILQLI